MSHRGVVGLRVSPPCRLEANLLVFLSIAVLGAGVSAFPFQMAAGLCWMSVLLQKHGSDTDAQQTIPRAIDAHTQPWESVPRLLDEPRASKCSPQYPTDFFLNFSFFF